jgi:hypothetical protein
VAKQDKDEVDYGPGHVEHHCGPVFIDDRNYCRFFIPGVGSYGTCDKVKGVIDPKDGCRLFERVRRS